MLGKICWYRLKNASRESTDIKMRSAWQNASRLSPTVTVLLSRTERYPLLRGRMAVENSLRDYCVQSVHGDQLQQSALARIRDSP